MASKFLLLTVFVLNVIAFALAVVAERRRTKGHLVADNEKNYEYCQYGSDIATGLGAGAFLFHFVSQIIVMFGSRCYCCGRALSPGGSRAWALVFFIISWLFFFVAEVCLFAASIRNAYHTKYIRYFKEDGPSCEVIRRGVFAAGAAFILLNTIVAELYYVCYSNARDKHKTHGGESGVGMGTYR